MTSPPAVRHIPLDKLVPSPTNVRKTPPSAAEDAELKASIRARGLKQNLVVHPSPGEKGVHAVTAGGRRLKALQELAAEGVIPADFRVPCLVEEPEAALETSLMENRIRAALSPADEFVAMAALIDRRRDGRGGRHPLRRLGAARPAAPAARQAGARTARRLPQRRHQPRCRHRLHARRRSSGAARRVASAQGPVLHPALYGAASVDPNRDPARLRSRAVCRQRRLRGRRRHGDARSLQRRRRGLYGRCRPRPPAGDREARTEGRRIALLLGLDPSDARSRIRLHRAIPPRPSATGRASGGNRRGNRAHRSSVSRNSRKPPRTSGPTR